MCEDRCRGRGKVEAHSLQILLKIISTEIMNIQCISDFNIAKLSRGPKVWQYISHLGKHMNNQ